MSHESLILPYAVEHKGREKPFTQNMEVASILCLAEADRKKPGILDASSERISFFLKLHYPLWAVPWENECLMLDGLGVFSTTITYMKLPDVNLFVEDLKRGATAREQFKNALEKHFQTFKEFAETLQVSVEAIVADEELLSVFSEYIEEVLALKTSVTGHVALMPPRVDENTALKNAEKLIDCWRQIQSDVKGLQYAISVINEETKFHEQMIMREIEQLQQTYEKEIALVKPVVEQRVERLLREREAKIEKVNRVAERELKAKQGQKERRERELERLEQNMVEYKKRRNVCKRRDNEIGVSRWEHKIKTCQNKISDIKKKVHVLSQSIEQFQKQNEVSVEKLRQGYQVLIDRESKKIADIETSRDAVIEEKQKEAEMLRSANSLVMSQIERLREQKGQHASKLKKMAIPWKSEHVTLVCVPLYVVKYDADGKPRYSVYAPLRAMSSSGIKKKIQKAIRSFSLESRIKLLLSSRSKMLEKMFNTIICEKIEKDKTLEKAVCELGSYNSVFNNSNFTEMLTTGAEELQKEGWITSEEEKAIVKAYS